MSGDRVVEIQHQVRENSEELQNYLLDLVNWEKDMKQKDEEMRKKRLLEENDLPPIRSSVSNAKKNKKYKSKRNKEELSKNSSISDDESESKEESPDSLELKDILQSETTADVSDKFQKKQNAVRLKDKGNEFFKKGDYKSAIKCYTSGIQEDSENAVLAANRAMAYLKTGELTLAETDCSSCLSLDPTYVKAYMRRGTARYGLKKYDAAKDDFLKALELEPENKQAKSELKKIEVKLSKSAHHHHHSKHTHNHKIKEPNSIDTEKEFDHSNNVSLNSEGACSEKSGKDASNKLMADMQTFNISDSSDYCVISPIQKAVHERSKKPLITLKVKDVGIKSMEDSSETKSVDIISSENVVVEKTEQNDLSIDAKGDQTVKIQNTINMPALVLLPPVPQTSLQFLADWKKMRYNPDLQYKYLKQFPAENFSTVFKQSMEVDLFCGILKVLSTSFIENHDDVFPYMKYLYQVGRFQTLIRFLTSEEQNALKAIFSAVESSSLYTSDELCTIMQKYVL